MNDIDFSLNAGKVLKRLIRDNYDTQEEFAYDFGTDIRTVSRYVNQGINKVSVLQELASFFRISITDFFYTKKDDD